MDREDALFEDMQALSDDAETLGLTDVALVLEFAMDVYLHEKVVRERLEKAAPEVPVQPTASGLSEPTFLLAQVYRHAS